MVEGYLDGDICNRNGCDGYISEHYKEGSCSCHTNPPCGYCTEANQYCDTCGWDAKEEQRESEKRFFELNKHIYEEQANARLERDKLFYKKYRGDLEAESLEIKQFSHTHFSMRIIGVFPKNSETQASLLPKVSGTFGGRFTRFDSYSFEYIAYTD